MTPLFFTPCCKWYPIIAFSQTVPCLLIPFFIRSCGTYPIPKALLSLTLLFFIFFPRKQISLSGSGETSPIRVAAISLCPDPATPAIPTISPSWISKDTSSTRKILLKSFTDKWLTLKIISPLSHVSLFAWSMTSRPTIILASISSVSPSFFLVPIAFPSFRTVT